MRAAVIFGPGSSISDLKPFQKNSAATWLTGLPADPNAADAILIFGGDGTVHRHLAELVKLRLPVLVVPCGSGNDFAHALNLHRVRDSLAVWRRFSSGGENVRNIDLGVISPLVADRLIADRLVTDGPITDGLFAGKVAAPPEHYFCCVGGVGLDGDIARRANRLPRWLRAHGGYALSFLPALMRFAPVAMKISMPGAEDRAALAARSAQPVVVAAFANGPAYGSGMQIAPHAKLDDGVLDVCIIPSMNKLKLFCLFPTIYFGRHLRIRQVKYFQTKRLAIETDEPLDVYADGEYVCRTPIEVRVARAALRLITA
jgi:diacylglycerol kinase (ATP)